MKHDTYHRYAALFDAAHSAPSGMIGLQLHGNDAGAALREWAQQRKIAVVTGRLERCNNDGTWSWSVLRADCETVDITVHLEDDMLVPTGDVAGAGSATAREQEIRL